MKTVTVYPVRRLSRPAFVPPSVPVVSRRSHETQGSSTIDKIVRALGQVIVLGLISLSIAMLLIAWLDEGLIYHLGS